MHRSLQQRRHGDAGFLRGELGLGLRAFGFRVWGLGCRVWGMRLGVLGGP